MGKQRGKRSHLRLVRPPMPLPPTFEAPEECAEELYAEALAMIDRLKAYLERTKRRPYE